MIEFLDSTIKYQFLIVGIAICITFLMMVIEVCKADKTAKKIMSRQPYLPRIRAKELKALINNK